MFVFNISFVFRNCRKVGHTKRSCLVRRAQEDPNSVSEDDKAFWAYVIMEERPNTMAGREESEEEEEEGGEETLDSDSSEEMYDNVM